MNPERKYAYDKDFVLKNEKNRLSFETFVFALGEKNRNSLSGLLSHLPPYIYRKSWPVHRFRNSFLVYINYRLNVSVFSVCVEVALHAGNQLEVILASPCQR